MHDGDELMFDFNEDQTSDNDVSDVSTASVAVELEHGKPKKGKKPKGKFLYVTFVGGVIIVMTVVIILVVLSKANKPTFYSQLDEVFNPSVGGFSYTFRIESGARGSLGTVTLPESVSMDSVENADEISETDSTLHSWDARVEDWGNSSGTETHDWQYPCYEIRFEGNITSLEPLSTHFDVLIADLSTGYSDAFTDVTLIDGVYYINVEQMRYWLLHSKNSYFMNLGSSMPDGQKYLVISADEFSYFSRYAEAGDEQTLSVRGDISTIYMDMLRIEKTLTNRIYAYNGETGLSYDKSSGIVGINLNSEQLTPVFKNMILNAGDLYTNNIQVLQSDGFYNESQFKQAVREKDNFIASLYDLTIYFNIADAEMTNMSLTGNIRPSTNDFTKVNELEASFQLGYSLEDMDVRITGYCRKTDSAGTVSVPDGSQMTLSSVVNPLFVEETINAMMDYCNVTGIDLSRQLEITPASIRQNVLDDFINLVNGTEYCEYYLTRSNVGDFLERYANYTVDADSSNSDLVCKAIVDDFYAELNQITGDNVQVIYITPEEEIDHTPDIEATIEGCEFVITYNEEKSTARLIVNDMFILNPTDDEVTIDLTEFNLRVFVSTFATQNFTSLYMYDNNITESDVQTEITIQPSGFARVSVRTVIDNIDNGSVEMDYKGEQIGVVMIP